MRGGSCHAGCPASARDARSRDRDAAGRVLRAHGRQAGLLAANRDRGPSARHDAASPSFLAPPKTSASVRTIPPPQVVVGALAEHLATFAAHADGFVFTLGGKPVHRTAFGHLWRPVVKTAGLPTGTGFHAMRHYYASLLIRHGESVKTVQARLGHASAVETLDTYSHLWPDSGERSREAVDSVLGNPADCVRTSEARDSITAGQRRVVDESAYRPDSVRAPARPGDHPSPEHRHRCPRAAYPRTRASSPRTPAQARRTAPSWPCSGWGLPSRRSHLRRWWSLTPPFHPYPHPLGARTYALQTGRWRSVSVALSRESPRVGVTHHPARWSPDLPRRTVNRPTRPPGRLIHVQGSGDAPQVHLAHMHLTWRLRQVRCTRTR